MAIEWKHVQSNSESPNYRQKSIMNLAYPSSSTKKTTAQFAFIPTHHFNNITRLYSNASKTINKFTEKPSSADKQSEEKNKAFNHMKRRQPKVRG